MAERTDKQLDCTRPAAEHQKAWFAELRQEVFAERKPYAIVQADMPLELFSVMDVPVVSNQWWAAVIAAKRMSATYFDTLNEQGFHDGLCRYCSLGLVCTLANDPTNAPWGGLPKPALLSARLTCDCIQRVFHLWAQAFDAPFVPLDNTGATHLPPRWWELSRHRWQELFEPHRLDHMVAEMRTLIGALEKITQRKFDLDRLRRLMEAVNQQERYFEEARELISRAPRGAISSNTRSKRRAFRRWKSGRIWWIRAVGNQKRCDSASLSSLPKE